MAIHSVDYDRGFEGLLRGLLSGDVGIAGSGFGSRFAGGLLGCRGRAGAGRLGLVLFREVLLQPFGRETHGGLVEEGRGGGSRKGCIRGLAFALHPVCFISGNIFEWTYVKRQVGGR